ncbi:MAG TPA: hypothetical protein VK855_08555 [Thioalkalivibrio sp.]|nr:hypothetical protein [Thioalkalivibrio sp.]
MKVLKSGVATLFVLVVLTLGAEAAGNEFRSGPSKTFAADCVGLATDAGDYHVVHAIWQRPDGVASGDVPRHPKIWI